MNIGLRYTNYEEQEKSTLEEDPAGQKESSTKED